MRSSRTSLSTLLAVAAIAMMGSGAALAGPASLRHAGSGNNRRPTPARRDTQRAREIADHNEAVERRKAEKKARKLAMTAEREAR